MKRMRPLVVSLRKDVFPIIPIIQQDIKHQYSTFSYDEFLKLIEIDVQKKK